MHMNTNSPEYEQEYKQLQHKAFSAVAHDLRTPLSCIIGSLQTIDQMKDKLSAAQHDALIKSALTEAQRLDSLFSSVLEKAKTE